MYFGKNIPEKAEFLRSQFEGAGVIWVLGTPYCPPKLNLEIRKDFIWRRGRTAGLQCVDESLCF